MTPPRPRPALDLSLLLVLGLAVNALAARFITLPGYVDAYYYFDGALQWAHGQPAVEPFLWNYLAPQTAAANAARRWPSNLYWMPLTSLVAAPALAAAERIAGSPLPNAILFRATQVPFILLASILPLLSYGAARLMSPNRRHALAAALLTLFCPYYFVYWTTTDAFALFAVTASGGLLAALMAERQPRRARLWLLAAGLSAGLAHLARADGLLILVCLLVWVSLRAPAGKSGPARFGAIAALIGGYLLVMLPWFVRNLALVGAPLPSGSLRSLWLTNYDDFFAFPPQRLALAAYLASGAASILSSKWLALQSNLATLAAAPGGFVAFPFILIGLWRLRTQPLLRLALFYGAALLAAMTLVFTFPGMRGGFFHSGAALLPFLMPAAVAGLDAAVEAAARRLPHWQPARAQPVFTGLLVLCSAALTAAVFWARVVGPNPARPAWSSLDQAYRDAGDWLQSHGQSTELVVLNNPPGWFYFTGQPAVVIPSGGRAELMQVLSAFGGRWVLLDANHPAPLASLYTAPEADPALQLRATFAGVGGQPAYLFELAPGP